MKALFYSFLIFILSNALLFILTLFYFSIFFADKIENDFKNKFNFTSQEIKDFENLKLYVRDFYQSNIANIEALSLNLKDSELLIFLGDKKLLGSSLKEANPLLNKKTLFKGESQLVGESFTASLYYNTLDKTRVLYIFTIFLSCFYFFLISVFIYLLLNLHHYLN